ncbi:MAG: choice-of-anchor D domain-containing protein [Proteobacteria bacterium]|nr:choice-of-anchor D domain-containing protein [Pseudomonadota bacterium]MCP4917219.1 choice-of-anchor D domain-containing protein [Pseudomonadota bacterium]
MTGALTLLLACSGSDTQISALTPELTLSPEEVDFGDVVVDYSEGMVVEVINTGLAPLDADVTLAQDDGVYTIEPATLSLPRGERTELLVTFTPSTYLDYDTELVFTTNVPEAEGGPELRFPLTGTGTDGPTPDIQLDQTSLDFDVTAPGDIGTLYFTIDNVGDGDLVLGGTNQTGSGAFSLPNAPGWMTIAPNSSTTVVVLYAPTTLDGDNGSLELTSNDPDEPSVTVTLLGNGGGDFEYPVAVIDGPDEAAPPITVDLDGSGSYDPGGWELTAFEWTMTVAPDGSEGELRQTDWDVTDAYLDIAGRYEVQLVVENELGVRSAPAKYSVEAVPIDAIHVEMFWDQGAADLDLHLLDGQDSPFYERPGDACYCNANPDWGTSSSDDDPSLDLDDIHGYGPENINIYAPASGEYPIRVFYYDNNGDGAATATVRVYLNGDLESESSKLLSRNEAWQAGIIKWPDAVVVDEDDAIFEPEDRGCY